MYSQRKEEEEGLLNVKASLGETTKQAGHACPTNTAEDNVVKAALPKMGTIQTFFSITKAYLAINVLLLPMAFKNGGFALSPIALLVAVFFEGLSAVRLSNVARQYKVYSYPLLM